jgi:signal transduction histidine kinase
VELALSPVETPEGLHVLAIVRDLTERLQARVLRQEAEALRRVNVMKDQLLGVLSHELRTPLNFITGFGSLLEDEVAGPLNQGQRDYLQKMMRGADRMLDLVNDLLDFSRLQAGALTLALAPMALPEVVHEVAANLAPRFARKDQRFINLLPADLPEVIAEDARVIQILTNLLVNASKFTPDGGTLTVRASVQDGVGLGLSICKGLVEAMGGHIGVHSQPGQGSTFWFTLPLRGAANVPALVSGIVAA